MPAKRSRTHYWRRCLQELCDRRGSLEIAIKSEDDSPHDLIWRVRLVKVTHDEIVLEEPMTLGEAMGFEDGIELVVILAIGQNRWMFTSIKMASTVVSGPRNRSIRAMRMTLPEAVERCQRRNFYRVETAELHLPEVEIWPLLDPKSVVLAERDNECRFRSTDGKGMGGLESEAAEFDMIMPEVGPKFHARLVNIGGGGLGLDVSANDTGTVGRHRLYWIRFLLPPDMSTPICATAKIVHSHIQSNHHVYAGMAFDFSFNPGHQRFVVEQICRYIAIQQRIQMQRRAHLRPAG